jgi:hypothetical protein
VNSLSREAMIRPTAETARNNLEEAPRYAVAAWLALASTPATDDRGATRTAEQRA